MRNIDILESFETEIGAINSTVKPNTEDSLFWLNQAAIKFVKLRFNGDFVHKTSYEQNEKRRNDLINLYKSHTFSLNGSGDYHTLYNSYHIEYPEDFLFSLNEDVVISDTEGNNETQASVFECTSDSFMFRITNSLTDFHYMYGTARPIRVRTSNGCDLLTDKMYNIKQYTLGYLRKPNEITLNDPHEDYEDFDNITMPEIIKMAALMYLENQGNQRYKTITQEVMTQE